MISAIVSDKVPENSTARVAVHPIHDLLEYLIPENLRAKVRPGMLVRVPLGRRESSGLVVETGSASGRKDLRPILEVFREDPVINPELLELLKWAAGYYLAPLSSLAELALPPGLENPPPGEPRTHLFRMAEGLEWEKLLAQVLHSAPVQAEILKQLADSRELSLSDLPPEKRTQYLRALREMKKKGWVKGFYREEELPAGARVKDLTPDQEKALAAIEAGLGNGVFETHLLFGVTASGKTEIYLRAAARALAAQKGVIILVPEIALVPQIAGRFRAHFGARVSVLHSGLPRRERINSWVRIQAGLAPVVIGTRSAIFAPLPAPGLIVVDEEYDEAYKQEEGVHYNARDLATVRGKLAGATVILGTATPALESYFNAEAGKYRLLNLPVRVDGRALPPVTVVDLRTASLGSDWTRNPLSPFLKERITAHQKEGGKVILFLNRRGYSSSVLCQDCGQALRCPNCSVSLILHKARKILLCHYCGFSIPPPDTCPACNSPRVRMFGVGTERIEEDLTRDFPGLSFRRLDRDTAHRIGAPARILQDFAAGGVEMLVGTKMVTKGHDLPGVSLVGVVLADLSLDLPDFRAAERTFELLAQVAGRAGRGEHHGEVVVQTFLPDHYVINLARTQDYPAFYRTELEFRRKYFYPPFSRLVQILVSGVNARRVEESSEIFKEELERKLSGKIKKGRDILVLGPAPAAYAKIRGRHRFQILIKFPPDFRIQAPLAKILESYPHRQLAAGVTFSVDIDPQSLL